jgi:tetratricopeptide (TPR) repeat protein
VLSPFGLYLWYQSVRRGSLQALYFQRLLKWEEWRHEQDLVEQEIEKQRAAAAAAAAKLEARRRRIAGGGAHAAPSPAPTVNIPIPPPSRPAPLIDDPARIFGFQVRRIVKLSAFLVVVVYGFIIFRTMDRPQAAMWMHQKAVEYHQMGLSTLPLRLEYLALRVDPDCLAARINFAHYSFQKRHFAAALKQYAQLYALEPSNTSYRLRYAWSHYFMRNYELARREFLAIANKKGVSRTDTVEALTGLGESAAQSGDLKQARDAYFTILNLQPENEAALRRLSELQGMELKKIYFRKNIPKPDQVE